MTLAEGLTWGLILERLPTAAQLLKSGLEASNNE
jgi:hypothetical protein